MSRSNRQRSATRCVVLTSDAYAWTGQAAVNRGYAANGLNQYSAVAGTGFGYEAGISTCGLMVLCSGEDG